MATLGQRNALIKMHNGSVWGRISPIFSALLAGVRAMAALIKLL
jgi:hypothetical protein